MFWCGNGSMPWSANRGLITNIGGLAYIGWGRKRVMARSNTELCSGESLKKRFSGRYGGNYRYQRIVVPSLRNLYCCSSHAWDLIDDSLDDMINEEDAWILKEEDSKHQEKESLDATKPKGWDEKQRVEFTAAMIDDFLKVKFPSIKKNDIQNQMLEKVSEDISLSGASVRSSRNLHRPPFPHKRQETRDAIRKNKNRKTMSNERLDTSTRKERNETGDRTVEDERSIGSNCDDNDRNPLKDLTVSMDSEDEDKKVGTQHLVVQHLLEGHFDEDFLSKMPVSTLNWSIATIGKHGRSDTAEQLFHWMRLRQIANEHSLVQLFRALELSKSSPKKALSTWHNVRRMSKSFIPAERAAAALLKTFRQYGSIEDAMKVLKYLERTKTPLNRYAYNVVMRIAADCGDAETALELLEKLVQHRKSYIEAGDNSSGISMHPDLRSFSAALSALEKSNKCPRVVLVHRMIADCGIVCDATLSMQLISCYARCGRPQDVESILDTMNDNGIRPNRSHWNGLLHAYAEARNYDGALNAYRRMTSITGILPDSYTLVAVLSAASRARSGPVAASWALSVAKKYNVPMSVHLASAIISCCRYNIPNDNENRDKNKSGSLAIVAEVRAAMQAAKITPNVHVLNAAMAAHADAEDWEGVATIFDELEKNSEVDPDKYTWKIVIQAFEKAGWWGKVENVEALKQTWHLLHGKQDH